MQQLDLSKIKIEEFLGDTTIQLDLSQKTQSVEPASVPAYVPNEGTVLRNCPKCSELSFKIENGCNSCVNPDCGYAKCDM